MTTSDDKFSVSLNRLASKQAMWRNMEASDKLQLIEESLKCLREDVGVDGFLELGRAVAKHTKGILDKKCIDFELVTAEESSVPAMICLSTLEDLARAYRVKAGSDMSMKCDFDRLPKSIHAASGAVTARIFPLTTVEAIAGPSAGLTCDAFFDPQKVQCIDDIEPFAFDNLQAEISSSDSQSPDGVHIVLGAGNHGFLAIVDVLDGLFVKNRVVFCKHHPLRGADLDPLMRTLFRPLYEAGVLDSECDGGVERTQSILHHPAVLSAHITGSKATHDAIVWGSKKVEDRKEPIFSSTMSAELGCVTPWIVAPGEYTPKEMRSTIANMHEGVWMCASANCNSTKVIVMNETWPQRRALVDGLVEAWRDQVDPCAYYPGAETRWQTYRKAYPEAREIYGQASSETDSCRLPLLLVELEVDLSTQEGREAVKGEIAFTNEPFCPVLTIATMKSDKKGDVADFMEGAANFCNRYLFGTLSASMSVPKALDGVECIEKCIGDLEYGSVVVNVWSAYGYAIGIWGGYGPRESLQDVQSGLGSVRNRLFLKDVHKVIVRGPCDNSAASSLKPLRKQTASYFALLRLGLSPSVGHLLEFLSVQFDFPSLIPSPTTAVVGAGLAAAAVSAALRLSA